LIYRIDLDPSEVSLDGFYRPDSLVLVFADTDEDEFNIELPDATDIDNVTFRIKNTGTNNLNFSTKDDQKIDEADTATIASLSSLDFGSDLMNWWIN